MKLHVCRLIPLWIALILAGGCAGGNTSTDFEVRFGKIVAREEVDLEQERSRSRVNTSIGVGVSSGGGVSIGLGFLLSPLFTSHDKPAVRYDIDLLNGERMTVYHSDANFAPGDCVEVRIFDDSQKHPPQLRRNDTGC